MNGKLYLVGLSWFCVLSDFAIFLIVSWVELLLLSLWTAVVDCIIAVLG
jgi:hypothetical protein